MKPKRREYHSTAAARRPRSGGTTSQGHGRFGYARDGQLVFDDDEWRFREDLDSVPDEVRALFDLGWFDLSDGERLAAPDVRTVAVRQLQYVGSD